MTSHAGRLSPAETITAAIVARLEQGTRPWVQPWSSSPALRPLRACGQPYRGINRLWLGMVAQTAQYHSPSWLTYRQAQALGGQVRKGEHGSIAIFYSDLSLRDPAEASEDPDDAREVRRVLKTFVVFNADQIDGLPDRFDPPLQDSEGSRAANPAAQKLFASIPANVRHGGDAAYYRPDRDEISMPSRALFRDEAHYLATLAHELSHWTGHELRLARSLEHRFGSEAYAVEELIAELSAAFVGAEVGLGVEHLDHHASYLSSWLKVLKRDHRAIFTVAAKAEEAASLLLRLGHWSGHGQGLSDKCDEGSGRLKGE